MIDRRSDFSSSETISRLSRFRSSDSIKETSIQFSRIVTNDGTDWPTNDYYPYETSSVYTQMSRYYFDLHNGAGPLRDDHGVELATLNAVTQEATRILLDIARDEVGDTGRLIVTVTVRDEEGNPISIASLTFSNEWLENPKTVPSR